MENGLRSDWDRLIQPGMVHGSLYYDEMIFKEELERNGSRPGSTSDTPARCRTRTIS